MHQISNLQSIHKNMETTKYCNHSSRSCWINAKCGNDDDACLQKKGHKKEETLLKTLIHNSMNEIMVY